MSSKEPAEDSKKHIQRRIIFLERLRQTFNTPLLEDEIDCLTKLYRAVSESLRPEPYEGLEKQFAHVESHWERVHQSAANVVATMVHLENMFRLLLYVLYGNYGQQGDSLRSTVRKNYVDVSETLRSSNREKQLGDKLFGEMVFDREHASSRVSAFFITKDTFGFNEADRLVDQRDWRGLASLISKDKDLVKHLQSGAPRYFLEGEKVMLDELPDSVDAFQNKYFYRLRDATSFEITDYARKLPLQGSTEAKITQENKGQTASLSQAVARCMRYLGLGSSSSHETPLTDLERAASSNSFNDKRIRPSTSSKQRKLSIGSQDDLSSISSEETVV